MRLPRNLLPYPVRKIITNNEICVVSFVSTYFGDCAWKLNLARAAFICVEKKTAVLSQSLCQICAFHPNFKEKVQMLYLSLFFLSWEIHVCGCATCRGKRRTDISPSYIIAELCLLSMFVCNYWLLLQL